MSNPDDTARVYRTCPWGDIECFVNHCGGVFVPRTNGSNGQRFYGCSNYPRCHMTRDIQSVSEEIACRFLGECGDPDEPRLEHGW